MSADAVGIEVSVRFLSFLIKVRENESEVGTALQTLGEREICSSI